LKSNPMNVMASASCSVIRVRLRRPLRSTGPGRGLRAS
jgi:hypothetical protein